MVTKMHNQKIYSVVDLETTGTNYKNGDRIIQIGCVLFCDGKIVNRFESLINPQANVPLAIEQLTGISNHDVKRAPLFDDVAATVFSLLSDTTFVAHNVNFDFPFLNAELERAGFPVLEISAIDTVTLSQILLPTEPSFRLRDLTKYLAIDHDSPHSADSDAEATSQLLNKLLIRLQDLPTVTLQQLVNLRLDLPYETAQMFQNELASRTEKRQLPNSLYQKENLILHRPHRRELINNRQSLKYPKTKSAKEKLYQQSNTDGLDYRQSQARMMNAIFNNYTHENPKNMIIEAGTGTGKSLGYLLPMTYLTYPEHKVVISTATNVLQEQLKRSVGDTLNPILPFTVSCVVLKGNSHYIDLAKFDHSLSMIEDAKPVQMTKAKLLVWLLETQSGDLDELNLNSYRLPYFTEIRHQGINSLNRQSRFYEDDFLVRRQTELEQANIVIVNHAYLAQHATELGQSLNSPYLVVDEAQHLSDSILKKSRHQISFPTINAAIHILQGLVNAGHDRNLREIFNDLPLGLYNIDLLRSDLVSLETAFKQFEQALYRQFMLNVDSQQAQSIIEQTIDNHELAAMLQPSNKILLDLEQALGSLHLHFNAIYHLFSHNKKHWLASDRYLVTQFQSQLMIITKADETLHHFSDVLIHQIAESVFWLTVHQSSEKSNLQLSGGLLTTRNFLASQVYPAFQKPTFVGATLFSSGRSRYLYDQLDVNPDETRIKKFASPFDFKNQAKMMIAADAPLITANSYHQYIEYLSKTIYRVTKDNPRQTLILFNSLLTIEQVYSQLHSTDLFLQREILAQGITGNKEKVLKQFLTGNQSILLGASSFWEGIDLPKSQLELLIITRLPFDFPDAVLAKAESNWLKQNHKNPFYGAALPKATLRIRQGMGRLIRTPADYGVAIVLDKRLSERKYGHSIMNTLPAELPIDTIPTDEIIKETKAFFKKHE